MHAEKFKIEVALRHELYDEFNDAYEEFETVSIENGWNSLPEAKRYIESEDVQNSLSGTGCISSVKIYDAASRLVAKMANTYSLKWLPPIVLAEDRAEANERIKRLSEERVEQARWDNFETARGIDRQIADIRDQLRMGEGVGRAYAQTYRPADDKAHPLPLVAIEIEPNTFSFYVSENGDKKMVRVHQFTDFRGSILEDDFPLGSANEWSAGMPKTFTDIEAVNAVGRSLFKDWETLPKNFPVADAERLGAAAVVVESAGEAKDLSDDQRAAVAAFRDANGRDWKEKLGAMWMNGTYSRRGLDADQAALLQQVRNQFGPEWLVNVTRADLDAPKRVEDDDADLSM